ncbi:hypothetical protein F5884DRAFT_775673 [Xylogone sp. PMI_703]|nr:hypothetical protein F5884DRAFT_775673 [Xylogone sp. PMI_703]
MFLPICWGSAASFSRLSLFNVLFLSGLLARQGFVWYESVENLDPASEKEVLARLMMEKKIFAVQQTNNMRPSPNSNPNRQASQIASRPPVPRRGMSRDVQRNALLLLFSHPSAPRSLTVHTPSTGYLWYEVS